MAKRITNAGPFIVLKCGTYEPNWRGNVNGKIDLDLRNKDQDIEELDNTDE